MSLLPESCVLTVSFPSNAELGIECVPSEAAYMCSNFGLNLHPGRKPCALQWQWYSFITHLYSRFRRRFFPKALRLTPDREGFRSPRH